MSVYVDNARIPARVGRVTGRWSHLTADTPDELHRFAVTIGLKRAWFQTCRRSPGCQPAEVCPHWHYDLTDRKRQQALDAGAHPIELGDWARIIRQRRGRPT